MKKQAVQIIAAIVRLLDRVTEIVGRFAAVFSVLMVLVTCWIVVNRYVFNQGSIPVQESVTYFNALLFMLAAGYALKHDAHVRVDIFYSRAGRRARAWVDMLGSLLLLLPVSLFILVYSWDYTAAAWRIRESSPEPGGLPWVYLLKSLIPAMAVLLVLQGTAEFLRNFGRLFLGAEQESGRARDGDGDTPL